MKKILLTVLLLIPFAGVRADNTVTIVDTPNREATSVNYTNFRAPLQQAPLLKLPVGKVQPKGWLRKYLELQRDGLNGQLGSVSAWLDKNNNQWLSNQGDHGWEEVPYWIRGYSSLAYILDDEAMKQEVKTWIQAVLNNQTSNGRLGPDGYDGDSPDIWAKMPMLWALQTYYEATGSQRVLTAMNRYFKWEMSIPDDKFLKGLWQEKRGGDNLWSVLWLYNRNGDQTILPLIDKLHNATSDWTMKGDLPNYHGVNVAQGFREPATYYIYTGDKEMLQATYNAHNEMRRRYGQMPGGMYAADENARAGYYDPRNGAETCALVEQMASDEILMGITGDVFWADHCENVAFNSFPAALTPDMRALRYITSANMAISDEKNHAPSIDNSLRGMLSMSPFSSRCCQHNHGMGWPYFTEHLVMATADNGLATMLYAANETTAMVADGVSLRMEEVTHYPFDETITLILHPERDVEFPLYLRIPAWAKGAEVSINNEVQQVEGDAAGRYICISRQWKEGDTVTLRLPMTVRSTVWQQNKSSVSVDYGPLTLSLKIDEEFEAHDSRDPEFVQDDSHWQEGVDASLWPCYVLRAKSDWNFGLVVDEQNLPVNFKVIRKAYPENDQPFTLDNVPLEFTAVGRQIPSWGFDATGMTDLLPTKFAPRAAETTPITLVPMGAARLRISAFPREKE
ncbi:MAG: glycoside hydrolase family 127 protein [Bacteroidaceae bacterium]|nr:glycoside hydrolase family 127 protein [Bacteroidaceae bacterium]